MALTTLEQQNLIRVIARMQEQLNKLQAQLSGVPIGTVRIKDLAVTDAKINELSVDKLTAGTLRTTTSITVHDTDNDEDIIIIGYQSGGF